MSELIRVTEILKEAGAYDFSNVNPHVLKAACDFGSATHKACELWDRQTLNIATLSSPLIPRLEAWKKFKDDYKIKEFLAIEEELISKIWGFMGHPDRIYQVNKTTIDIYDIKTAETLNPATGLQLAGYQILAEEHHKMKVRNRWSIQLPNEGMYKINPYDNRMDKQVFLSALQLYRWKKENLK